MVDCIGQPLTPPRPHANPARRGGLGVFAYGWNSSAGLFVSFFFGRGVSQVLATFKAGEQGRVRTEDGEVSFTLRGLRCYSWLVSVESCFPSPPPSHSPSASWRGPCLNSALVEDCSRCVVGSTGDKGR